MPLSTEDFDTYNVDKIDELFEKEWIEFLDKNTHIKNQPELNDMFKGMCKLFYHKAFFTSMVSSIEYLSGKTVDQLQKDRLNRLAKQQ